MTTLARDGRRVLCIERDLWAAAPPPSTPLEERELCEPKRIVGELLQPGGYESLARLGLRDALDGIDARPVHGYGVFLGDRRAQIAYGGGEEGRAFHNGRFLRRLREIGMGEDGLEIVQGNVTGLDREEGRVVGVSYRDDNKVERHVRAKLTIACDGCASNLRRRVGAGAGVEVYSKFVGLVLDVGEGMPFPEHGHVVLADPAPILFYQISSTEVRCLVDIPSSVRMPVANYLVDIVAPQVPVELRPSFLRAALDDDARSSMPNRVMPSAPAAVAGAVLLGDSFNMRHPLTGGGMTVALHDVTLIRDLLRKIGDLDDSEKVAEGLQAFYVLRRPLSCTINILANALYSVFCGTDGLEDMRIACFEYLAAGGRRSHDPMSMLGGLKARPTLLMAHFFAVAFYGCRKAYAVGGISKAAGVLRASFNVVKPLCDEEGLLPLSWLPFKAIPAMPAMPAFPQILPRMQGYAVVAAVISSALGR